METKTQPETPAKKQENIFASETLPSIFFKLALTGPSGSGKTFSALAIASGLGKKIALVDTENGSAALYRPRFAFDLAVMTPPYAIAKYLLAIQHAEKNGYDVLILDSITHAWAGEGGLLAKKELLDSRGGNSYTNWASITKEHESLRTAILNAKIHIIATMRSKQDYVLQENEKGKKVPVKVGLAPIQRDGMEYEFTTVLDLAMNHSAASSKDRTGLFDGQVFVPSSETGTTIHTWIESLKPAKPEEGSSLLSTPSSE